MEPVKTDPMSCRHERWEIRDSNTIGMGTCLDCGTEQPLVVLFNALHERMERVLRVARLAGLVP